MSKNEFKVYTLAEVAEKVGASVGVVRGYCTSGKIKGVKRFGRWYVTEENLKEFFKD